VPGCACASQQECGKNPARMSRPYPTASDAARHLQCGFDPSTCAGPIAGLFVIGTAGLGTQTQTALDAIAAAGGTKRARHVRSDTRPRPILDATCQPIALAQGAPEP
jgi:hypothetical protein